MTARPVGINRPVAPGTARWNSPGRRESGPRAVRKLQGPKLPQRVSSDRTDRFHRAGYPGAGRPPAPTGRRAGVQTKSAPAGANRSSPPAGNTDSSAAPARPNYPRRTRPPTLAIDIARPGVCSNRKRRTKMEFPVACNPRPSPKLDPAVAVSPSVVRYGR